MIETMELIALVVGILFGYWCIGRKAIEWLFVVLYSSAFSTKKSFYNLYDIADDDVSFEWYKDHNKHVKKYADYLKLHAAARSSAYETFKTTYDALSKALLTKILPISVAPAILFWGNWYFYLLGVVITVAILIVREVAKYGYRPGFYQRVAVFNSMNTYYKNKE